MERTYEVEVDVHIDDYHYTGSTREQGIAKVLERVESIRMNWHHGIRIEDATGPDPKVVYLRVRVEG